MKTCYPMDKKQSTQCKGRKRYKMEGLKSWQTKNPQREQIAKGTRTNKVLKLLSHEKWHQIRRGVQHLEKRQPRKTLTYNNQILLLMKQIHEEKQTPLIWKVGISHHDDDQEPYLFRQCIQAGNQNQNIRRFLKFCTFFWMGTQIWLIPLVDYISVVTLQKWKI